jgi:hypothetical protein
MIDQITITLASQTVRPGESLYASAFFFNASVPISPTSVDYKVEDVGTGELIRDWTPAVPGFTSVSVLLDGVDVALLDATDLKEFRRVTFRATSTVTVTASAIYTIFNLGYQSIVVSLNCQLSPELERYSPLPSSRISRNVELDNWNP